MDAHAEDSSAASLLAAHDVLLVRAPNPSALTLSGTNTWVVGRDPAYVVDPGPEVESHLKNLGAAISERGGLGGVVLTHDHSDHSEAVRTLLARHPAPLAAGRGAVDVELADGAEFGPFEAISAPGHAADHFALIGAGACFSGDAVLGEGSVFVAPGRGALAGYLRALERLRDRVDFTLICPGHGPLVREPRVKIEQYIAHRLDRERKLLAALEQSRRTVAELLDGAWSDVPAVLRPAAAVTLAAHLDKLEEEGRRPDGVERPAVSSLED